MDQTTHAFATLIAVVLLAGCGAAPEQATAPEATAPRIEEIPVTTESAEALAEFEAGREALDVFRNRIANAHFRSAIEKDPAFSFAYLNIANSATSAGEFKENLDAAAAHLEGKSDGERLLVEMTQTFISNDAEKRIQLGKKLVGMYPNSPRAWVALGSMQGTLNQTEDARDSLHQALALDPDLVTAHVVLGFSYLFSEPKDFRKAKSTLERVTQLRPAEAKGWENLGDVNRALQDLDGALTAYAAAAEKDPTLRVAQLKKGHISSFVGNFVEARAAYDTGIDGAAQVDQPNYSNYRAFVHLHAGDIAGALDELGGIVDSIDAMEALTDDQKRASKNFTLSNMATVALHHRMAKEAEAIIADLASVQREIAEVVGDETFHRGTEAGILIWEGQLAARSGDFSTARAKAEKNASLLEPDQNPRKLEPYYGLLGLTDLLEGKHEEAIENIRKSNLTVMYNKYHLALALEGAGRIDEARKIFKEVSEWNFNSVGFALVRKDAMERAAS